MTKIKIDLVNGTIDVEGEEAFVREIYGEYKDRLSAIPVATAPSDETKVKNIVREKPDKKSKPNGKNSAKKKESYAIVKDLDLTNGSI